MAGITRQAVVLPRRLLKSLLAMAYKVVAAIFYITESAWYLF
jgi:hypothetical protein